MENAFEVQGPPPVPVAPRIGMAIASLVMGILALVLSFLVVGAVFGMLGIVFGWIHLASERNSRAMAGWGLGLSIFGTLMSGAFIAFYGYFIYQFMPFMDYGEYPGEAAAFSEWEGVQAPDFTVTSADGTEYTLSDFKGKRVLLSVWASWEPGCKDEIPHFNQLLSEVSGEELVILGISDESEDTVWRFADDEGMKYPVAAFEELPEPFGEVIDVPVTFVIDRNGVIQRVLEGGQGYESLHAVATSPDYAGTPLDVPLEPTEELVEPEQPLEARKRWEVQVADAAGMCAGEWNGEGKAEILISTRDSGLKVLDADGGTVETISLSESLEIIELGHYHGKPRVLGYSNWGESIVVVDGAGEKVWDYSGWMGVNGAHWIDVDGDGTDEMVAGMNGAGGLHLVSADGEKLWKVRLGNVWNQSAIRTAGGTVRIMATDATGGVHLFDQTGERAGHFDSAGNYFTEIAAAVVDGAESVQILAGGTESTVALDINGRERWSSPREDDNGAWRSVSFASGEVNGDGRLDWAFFGLKGALLVVSSAGERLAELPGQAGLTSFAISDSMLVTLEGDTVTAYDFHPAGLAAGTSQPLEVAPEATAADPQIPQ